MGKPKPFSAMHQHPSLGFTIIVKSIEYNSSLDSGLVLHALETLGPLLELESLVDNSLDLDFAAV